MASGFHTQERNWKRGWEKKGRVAFREAAAAAQNAGVASGVFPRGKMPNQNGEGEAWIAASGFPNQGCRLRFLN